MHAIMDTNEDYKCGSGNGSGDDSSGIIIPPPSSNDNCRDDVALDSNDAQVGGATFSVAPPPHDDIFLPSPSSPPLRLLGRVHVMEPDRVPDCTTNPLLSPIISSPTFPPTDKESNKAPPLPEMIAALFEAQAMKPALTDDGIGATDPEGQIAVPFEGHVHKEVTQWKGEDDLAPSLPQMVAASFEGHGHKEEKQEEGEDDLAPSLPEIVTALSEEHGLEDEKQEEGEEDDLAPGLLEIVAALFEGHGYKEKKREEREEDGLAPGPPEMVAALYEAINNDNQEAKKKSPKIFEDVNNPQVLEEGVASVYEMEVNINSMQDIFDLLHDVFDDDGTPSNAENQESLLDLSSSSDQQHPTASNVQVSTFSITPSPQGGDQPSLAGRDQGHVEITVLTTEELMSPPRPHFDTNNQSLPLLDATLVQDVPNKPVYDAFPVSDTKDNDVHGWSKISLKLRVEGCYTWIGFGGDCYYHFSSGLPAIVWNCNEQCK